MGNDLLMTSIVSFGASKHHELVPRFSPDVVDLMMNEPAAELERWFLKTDIIDCPLPERFRSCQL